MTQLPLRARRGVGIAAILAVIFSALGAAPALAEDGERTITIAGSLQDELGCSADWQPDCAATTLPLVSPDVYQATFTVPAGSYEFKMAVDGGWEENYGAQGVADGPNIPLVLAGATELVISYDDVSHLVSMVPTDLPGSATTADKALAGDSLRTLLTKERFYFVMSDRFANGDSSNDRGGLTGGRLETGFDRSDKGFYHGGDLKGLTSKLDYIQDLGSTAIWLTPSFKNRPVQGPPGDESAGYHGYWITDFTQIDPHLGTNADMEKLIDQAHERGMKVFFDIITNHTADVINYREGKYTYINKTDSPYKTADGTVFDDRDFINKPFPKLDAETSFPYTPYFANEEDAKVKVPAWLNDPLLYHNRGDSTYTGESSTYGDFSGLDDLFTENRKVVDGMTEIYQPWVDLGIDGFRIDTVKHVNTEFWQQFSPAIEKHAADRGNPDFFMFGEVYDADPAAQSVYTTTGKLPATLDFGFQASAVAAVNGKPTSTLAELFAGDDYYTDTDSNAYNLPTFLGNHDMGRVGNFVGGDEQKDRLAHELMFTLRGQPVVYYGDEQGFIGDGGDKDARQDMFASKVDSYNDDKMIAAKTGSRDRFDENATMYRAIQKLQRLRAGHPTLADGTQITRYASSEPGIFAASRIHQRGQREYLVVANTAGEAKTAKFSTYSPQTTFKPIYGGGARSRSNTDGQVTVRVPAYSTRVLRATKRIPNSKEAPPVYLSTPGPGGALEGRTEIRAAAPANQYAQVSFAYRLAGTQEWTKLGIDDNAPYRVFHDVSGLAKGTMVEYRTVLKDNRGHVSASSSYGLVGAPPPSTGTGGGVGDVAQPSAVTVAGSLNSEMGCSEDWQPSCAEAGLTLDMNDKIWKGTYTLPAAPYAYKAAIDKSWDENYGAGGAAGGANIELTAGTDPITFYYDHRTHYVTSDAQGPIVVASGDFQSEMGCSADGDPMCMRSWLQDLDGDGTYSLATTQIPAGAYSVQANVDGARSGDTVTFTVPSDGLVTTLSYRASDESLTVSSAAAVGKPDLTTSAAYRVDYNTVAYPLERLPKGTDPRWLRFRIHWGEDLAINTTSLGGSSAALAMTDGAPDGYVRLRLDKRSEKLIPEIAGSTQVAIGVYDDSSRLLDATGVRP